MVIGSFALLEKLGLATRAEIVPVVLVSPPVAVGETLTVSVTESLAPAEMPVVREHVKVVTVHVQPSVKSVIAVAVRPAGSVTVSVVLLGSATVELVLVTSTVMVSATSPSVNDEGLVVMLIETVGTTTPVTKVDRSNSEYSSIFSCALI